MKKKLVGALLMLPLLLAGCSHQFKPSGAETVKITDSPTFSETQGFTIGKPFAAWANNKQTSVVLTTWGSSSCPNIPVFSKVNSPDKAVLTMKKYDEACTADLGPTVSEFKLPAGLDADKTIQLTLKSATNSTKVLLKPSSIFLGK